MFKSIVRPVRVSRFSKTVNFPQNNSSSIPANRQGFNFAKAPGRRCFVQPPTSSRTKAAALVVISKMEQTQRNPRTRDLIAHARARANPNPGRDGPLLDSSFLGAAKRGSARVVRAL